MIQKIINNKILKFILGGGVAASINLLFIFIFIEWLGFNTPNLRAIANAISIEISLLASFFIYRIWVWTGGNWTLKDVLLRQIPLYHFSAGVAVISRIFLIFPLLDRLGVNYAINTLVGVIVSAVLNYLISDRLIFKSNDKNTGTSESVLVLAKLIENGFYRFALLFIDNSKATFSYSGNEEKTAISTTLYSPEGLAPALETDFIPPISRSIIPKTIEVISIVIPAHNEEGCIVPTVQLISQTLEAKKIDYEILVVNDNSSDRTEVLLQELADKNTKIRYLNNYYPNGFGFAVRCGLENFQGDAVAVVMADNSDAPENIVDYYQKLREGYDCVFGSRFIAGGRVIDYPVHKLIVNRAANLFISVLFCLKFNDTTNAFKAYRREVIEGISPLLSHHFNLTVEMPLKAIIRGYSFAIIPISWQNRATGVSKLKIKEMGSRYLFIVLYAWLEKALSRGDYIKAHRLVYRPQYSPLISPPSLQKN
ncbi:MAG: glycosyltransferase [Microcystis viridis Mv_BB_P_19951000_S69]|jgi:dolichol-phosphate mannosyltransferase|uniref:Glycosyltransferase n=1 Tax=Microcystis viridis Mv_BB_P_19951000_S68D TaxID=2486270 RepID=A0A552HLN4_MICVR|nr:MAG: glycosyltransferase [Microcystis viridis Mv_BB_P_19951000_S68]TRU71131.1 MAG: glycosyltransferase [Microcystis viridis Mv_BB_P_19951000_S69]TRU72072.1 MAG: glycosyltransferase [Microcystis viridis Mv_BB_P_19951000_S68D]TRU85951.1 MAG: glycosyltransferase [Microcystis viridis Mv_BB_P_19951000_S69D]